MNTNEDLLPPLFRGWFASRGWHPRDHQLAMLEAARAGEDALLIAPTGGGKTLAGFLPSLIELADPAVAAGWQRLHTLYISPLKALAVDIRRNLEAPIADLRLPVTAEARTGDTPPDRRRRQLKTPPHLLMTTPESLALLLADPKAESLFKDLSCVVIDEIHALAGTKRGDLLALGLSRLRGLAPQARRVGLSATVAHPDALAHWLGGDRPVRRVIGRSGVAPEVRILDVAARMPWAGHASLYALPEVLEAIAAAKTTIVFVNTRAVGELVFQELWQINERNMPIGLHHGSLAVEQRRKVEAAMAANRLRAVVATSSLDLGIDWGGVDQVIQMGAPKGVSRLLQRIGRANHRFDEPSRAILVPGNRFELLECEAALAALATGAQDGEPPGPGGLDVLAQHIMGVACNGPFDKDALYREVTATQPYAGVSRADYDDVFDFVATGGYALRAYDRFARLRREEDGRWVAADKIVMRQYRMNVGVIVEEQLIPVRLKSGSKLGDVEEYFISHLVPGDTFLFAGRILTLIGIRDNAAIVTPARNAERPKVPAYAGGRLPLTTHLADGVRAILADPKRWASLPAPVAEWLDLQASVSCLPPPDSLLVETFPDGKLQYLVAYGFAGRNAHQTLGLLLTRRLERQGARPMGFVATDYALSVWCLHPPREIDDLFAPDILGDDLEEWLAESSILRRLFGQVAVIAGLVDRKAPGAAKSGRQTTVSTDLIYDVLRRHQPDHILLRAARDEAARTLAEIGRLAELLHGVQGRIIHESLDRPSPLSIPVIAQIGRVSVDGGADEALMEAAAEEMMALAAAQGEQ